MHCSVTGMTGSGKSRLCREHILPAYGRQGIKRAVLDPLKQPWPAEVVTDDPEHFLKIAKASRSLVLIVDEFPHWVASDYRIGKALEWCFTIARNFGHLSYALAQRLMQIPPNVRNQCSKAVVFKQATADLQDLAILYDQPAILRAAAFPPGRALMVEPFTEPREIRTF